MKQVLNHTTIFLKIFVTICIILAIEFKTTGNYFFGERANEIRDKEEFIKTKISNKENWQKGLSSFSNLFSRSNPEPRRTNVNSFRLRISSKEQLFLQVAKHEWPVIISLSAGRLGNNIHNYALSLLYQKRFPNATYIVTESVHNYVARVLDEDSLFIPYIDDALLTNIFEEYKNMSAAVQPRNDDDSSYVEPTISSAMGKKYFVALEGYSLDIFKGFENLVFDSFKIRQDINIKAKSWMNEISNTFKRTNNATNVTFVGIHIRRGDYVPRIKNLFRVPSLPGKEFFRKAIQFYEHRLQTPIFIVCSDDTSYAKRAFKNRKNVYISANRTTEEHFAILSACSHSVMTIGTFGFWASFFAGGQVIYPHILDAKGIPLPHPLRMRNSFPNFLPISL